MADKTVQKEVGQLGQIRSWFGRPLWEMEPRDADRYFGHAIRGAANATRSLKAFCLSTYFRFIELRMQSELYRLTGRVAECPLDEMNTRATARGWVCGSRLKRARSTNYSPAGGVISRPAGSSGRRPGTSLRLG